MEHEIKIIMKFKDNETLKSSKTMLYIDDNPIGCIQNIKLEVDAHNYFPNLTITFPNLESDKIDPSYYKKPNLLDDVKMYIEKLKNIHGVNIVLEEIFK